MTNHNHPFHLVEKSPWPLTASLGALYLTSGLIKWFNFYGFNLFFLGFMVIIMSAYQWWRDVSREASYQGLHPMVTLQGLQMGMILFIVSEICFFFSFFWAFFHSSLSPVLEIGDIWPPSGVIILNPFEVPLLNTAILLASGVTVTWSHHSILNKNYSQSLQALSLTVVLGVYFTVLQGMEYQEASFSIADSVYGSIFFVATGFHGLHVIIGSIFLIVCLVRLMKGHFSNERHLGYECAIWYWHFVDVVWLFLYSMIYWWGS